MTRIVTRAGSALLTSTLLAALSAQPALAHGHGSHAGRHASSSAAHAKRADASGPQEGAGSSPQTAAAIAQLKALRQDRRAAKRTYNQTEREMRQARVDQHASEAKLRISARDERRAKQLQTREARMEIALARALGRGDTVGAEQIERKLALVRERLAALPAGEGENAPADASTPPTTAAEYQALSERLRSELPALAAAIAQDEERLAQARAELAQLEAKSGGA